VMDDSGIAAGAPAARWPGSCSSATPAARPCTSCATHDSPTSATKTSALPAHGISGHKRLATLQRYVKPSQAAIAALMAASDPDSRGH
jgi:hypothetical protein